MGLSKYLEKMHPMADLSKYLLSSEKSSKSYFVGI